MARQQYEVGGSTTTENRIALGTTGIKRMFKPIEPIEIISTLDVDRGIIADAGMSAIDRAGGYNTSDGDQGHKPDEPPRSLGGNRVAAAGATVLLLTGCASAQSSELPQVAPVTASEKPGVEPTAEKPAEKPVVGNEDKNSKYVSNYEEYKENKLLSPGQIKGIDTGIEHDLKEYPGATIIIYIDEHPTEMKNGSKRYYYDQIIIINGVVVKSERFSV